MNLLVKYNFSIMSLSKTQHKNLVDRMVRIDHAGEYAAKCIYQGQLRVLKGEDARIVSEMLESELEHFDYFERQIKERRCRPSLLLPLVKVVGYGLGVVTAKLGKESAMAATIAVEEAISEHYQEQLQQLGDNENELSEKISQFRDEEMEHLNIAVENNGMKARAYGLLSSSIKAGCRLAIKLVNYL